jgi:nucleoside-diphosphate-sugar epimerase
VFSRSAERVRALGVAAARASVGDAMRPESLTRAIAEAQPEVVINQLTNLAQSAGPLALRKGLSQTAQLRQHASATLVRAARAAGARRIISQSISFIYRPGPGTRTEDDPLWTDAGGQIGASAVPLATLESETLGSEGIEGVVLRYGAFYGPGTYYAPEGALSGLVRKRRMPLIAKAAGIFGFVHIDDAARATLAALEGPIGIFNVLDDVPAPTSEWIPFMAGLLGAKSPRHVPEGLAKLAMGPQTTYLMCSQPAVSNRRARTELDWSPRFADWHAGFADVFGPTGTT